jgi:hypothetical protein
MTQSNHQPIAEKQRLDEERLQKQPWRLWGPYLSERQWGTVREDYSANGDAWNYFTYDMSRSRAYRWGEDGIAGISDDHQHLCLALALWNGQDPHLKERLFGLTNSQGNHGEDVKELYYYLDATPTHSYLKALYKYPQRLFPYAQLIEENGRRGKHEPEFELLDTGIFDDDRYFDVFVEYAKASPTDLLATITAFNRGPDEAVLHILPQLWFRNNWSWANGTEKPWLRAISAAVIESNSREVGVYYFHTEGDGELLFSDNETNSPLLYDTDGPHGYYKDAFHDRIVGGNAAAVNPQRSGTKAAVHFVRSIPAGSSTRIRLRLTNQSVPAPFASFDDDFQRRRDEADAYYMDMQAGISDADARHVQRQALAGMIWGKQSYHYDVDVWLKGDPSQPPPPAGHRQSRNNDWDHVRDADILSMPDKWEYPWFAAWDLAFHCIPLALVDPEFAKHQILLLTREWYMHPNGQLPAYEWAFGDVNPPVHAWAAWRVFQIDRKQTGHADIGFLERVFHKLLLNFTWWVNRKDAHGRNIFHGGFLGLDNIGVFDRSAPLPTGGHMDQADATSWMAMFCLNLLRIALELSLHNPAYQDIATKFFEHFLAISKAMTNIGGNEHGEGLWDEQDEFYYDELHLQDGQQHRLRVRSMVGLIPLFAVEVLEPECLDRLPVFKARLTWYLEHRPDLAQLVSRWQEPGRGERRLLSLLRGHRMKCLLRRMLDETEFLSDHGVRALSRYHAEHPYTFWADGQPLTVAYVPGDSDSGIFGGNSNWRGPVWFPVNFLIIESLQKFHHYYTDDFKIECPTGSKRLLSLAEVAQELTNRLIRLFLRDGEGRRPVFGSNTKMQTDPHFRDYLLFHEYFHGDTGAGLGASHQTGWTGLVAKLLLPRRDVRNEEWCPNVPAFHKAAHQPAMQKSTT